MQQKTIKQSVSISGIGVHSGAPVSLTVLPAAPGFGICFKRLDIPKSNLIPARFDTVVDTQSCTRIANDEGVSVATIEHLMAAFAGLEITNALVEVTGPELPIMDGSSTYFMTLLESVGVEVQAAPARYLRILKPVEVRGKGGSFVRLVPAEQASFNITHDFGGRQGLTPQHCFVENVADQFAPDIASARTFGFYEDAQKLWDAGYALGASFDNTLIFDSGVPLNQEGARFENECARHKVLDAIGDLYLSGASIIGAFEAHNCGHGLNNQLLRALFSRPEAFEIGEVSVVHDDAREQDQYRAASSALQQPTVAVFTRPSIREDQGKKVAARAS